MLKSPKWKLASLCVAAMLAMSFWFKAQPLAAAPPFDMVDVPSRFVLTGNASEGELALDMDASYVAAPAFGNPVDTTGRRLIDSDRPYADWNTTTGINGVDQSVTFDLKSSLALDLALDEVALLFDAPQKPASVAVSFSENADGPWQAGNTLSLEDAGQYKDNWWRVPLNKVKARYVKLDFKLKEWGWYLREVKIYGAPDTNIGAPLREGEKLVLADTSGARAAIVVADRPFLNALEAAMLFQKLTFQMTGAFPPIITESNYDPKTAAVFIGDSEAARKRGVKIEQTPFGDDRYVMRSGANWLALVGNDQRPNKEYEQGIKSFQGSVYAVYDFFERQGFGWYGPQELWQVVPQKSSLVAAPLNVSEIPAFKLRHLWMAGLSQDEELRRAWRLGGVFVRINHSYDWLVPPKKYKEAHPEWFGTEQPDITHPEVIRIATETVIADFDARPDEPFVTYPVGANDTGGWKNPPFKPEVGNVAAQQLYFANEIAKGVRAARPDRHFSLGLYGYWFSHDGPQPMLQGEPEVVVYIVNEGNHAKPLDMPEDPKFYKNSARSNTRELAAIANWKKTGRLKGVWEWWVPVLANKAWKDAPWYDGDTTIRNLRLWNKEGFERIYYESQAEKDAGFPLRWAQYYIAARGLWNPQIDPHAVLLEANQKLFGPAAVTMTKFYELQEAAMRATDEKGGNWSLPAPHLIYTPEFEAQGEALLQKAAQELAACPADDKKRMRVAVEREQWKLLQEINVTARAAKDKVFKVKLDGKTMEVKDAKITGAGLRGLFGVAENVALEAVEFDGQNRAVLAGESYDLATGVTFRTAPAP